MPHLDIAAYFTQISWFLTLTLAFYLILQTNVLPALATLANLSNSLENVTTESAQNISTTSTSSLSWPNLESPLLTFSFRWNMANPCLNAFRSL